MDWNLIISISSLVISSLLTVGIFYVGAKASKIDKLQDQLEEKAGEIIDARMQVLESRLQVSIRSLEHIVQTMQCRLENGDQHFKGIDQKNHELELKVMAHVSELYKGLATKEDLKELQKTVMNLQMRLPPRHQEPGTN